MAAPQHFDGSRLGLEQPNYDYRDGMGPAYVPIDDVYVFSDGAVHLALGTDPEDRLVRGADGQLRNVAGMRTAEELAAPTGNFARIPEVSPAATTTAAASIAVRQATGGGLVGSVYHLSRNARDTHQGRHRRTR